MRHRFFVLGIVLTLAGRAFGQADSPKAALSAQDAAARAGKVDDDRGFYQADSEQQKKLAEVIAHGDIALARLQIAVARQFGKELAAAVAHAAGTEDIDDIQSATEKVDGDHATIEFKDHSTPLRMVKTDGSWKISLSDMLKDSDSDAVEQLARTIEKLTVQLNQIAGLVEHQKFRSGEGVRDRVQEVHDRLFGAAQDK